MFLHNNKKYYQIYVDDTQQKSKNYLPLSERSVVIFLYLGAFRWKKHSGKIDKKCQIMILKL